MLASSVFASTPRKISRQDRFRAALSSSVDLQHPPVSPSSPFTRNGSVCRLLPARDLNASLFPRGRKGKGRCPFPLTPIPAKRSLRFAPEKPINRNTHLTISITCPTINSPASLRSDRLIGFDKTTDRFQTRMLIAFPGIHSLALKRQQLTHLNSTGEIFEPPRKSPGDAFIGP